MLPERLVIDSSVAGMLFSTADSILVILHDTFQAVTSAISVGVARSLKDNCFSLPHPWGYMELTMGQSGSLTFGFKDEEHTN